MLGDSNFGLTLPIIKNRTNQLNTKAISGANFAMMTDEVLQLPRCNILLLQGGTNDAVQRNHPTDAIPDFLKLIRAAKSKAKQVVLVPPPPTCDSVRLMENIMCSE